MFSNLIESGSHAADLKRKGRFFLATTLFYGLLLAATGVGSIYAYNARLDYDADYEVISLMRFPPADVRTDQPPRDEARAAAAAAHSNQIAMRTEISVQTPYHGEHIARADTPELRPGQAVVLGRFNITPEELGGTVGTPVTGLAHGSVGPAGPSVTDMVEGPPPTLKLTPAPAPTPRQDTGPVRLPSTIISSKTIDKPAPPYPAIAKAAGVQGAVAVQIVVDEQGRVVSAKATSGNPLLQPAAVQAAYRARFTPTILGGQAVKVTGSITYNFLLR